MPRDERPLMAGADTPHVQTSTPTTAPSAAESPLPDTASLPMLRDVRVQKQRLPWMLIVVILVIGAIAGLVGAWAGTRQVGYFLCIGLSIPLFIMVSARIGDRATRKRLQAAAERGGQDPTSAMAEAVSRRVFWPSRAPPLLEMAKLLVGRGRLGESIRMQWQGEFEPVQPLTVAFEPRLLDESDAAFTELEAATICEPAAEGASPPVPAYRDNSPAFGHVRRNLRLKGGWAFVIMFAAFMFRSALEA